MTDTLSSQDRPSTLSQPPLGEQAYLAIKKLILQNVLKAGDHIKLAQLVDQLGLGRSPIHLALHRLNQEGLVEILPRKGILVKGETLDSFLDLLTARELVEPHLAAEATRAATAELLDQLQKLLELGQQYQTSGDRLASMEIDRRFHQALYEASGNKILSDFALQLLDRSMRLWFKPSPAAQQSPNIDELESIFAAIQNGDVDAVFQKMQRHIQSIRVKFMQG